MNVACLPPFTSARERKKTYSHPLSLLPARGGLVTLCGQMSIEWSSACLKCDIAQSSLCRVGFQGVYEGKVSANPINGPNYQRKEK